MAHGLLIKSAWQIRNGPLGAVVVSEWRVDPTKMRGHRPDTRHGDLLVQMNDFRVADDPLAMERCTSNDRELPVKLTAYGREQSCAVPV